MHGGHTQPATLTTHWLYAGFLHLYQLNHHTSEFSPTTGNTQCEAILVSEWYLFTNVYINNWVLLYSTDSFWTLLSCWSTSFSLMTLATSLVAADFIINVNFDYVQSFQHSNYGRPSPSRHRRTTLSGHIFATKACIDNRKKTC